MYNKEMPIFKLLHIVLAFLVVKSYAYCFSLSCKHPRHMAID